MKLPFNTRFTRRANSPEITGQTKSAGESKQMPGSLDLTETLGRPDYLGRAADAKHAANAAIKAQDYDAAWRLLHVQKENYLLHAQRQRFDADHTLSLDASVSEELSNVLRLEKKHDQALVHILYWIAASRTPIQRHEKKLVAYFGRCKFTAGTLSDAQRYLQGIKGKPNFSAIQEQVSAWR